MIEPGFTRTNLSQKGQVVGRPLTNYDAERSRVSDAVAKSIANGTQPESVASVVLRALISRNPRLRYAGGREANILSLLKRFAPSGILDKGVRRQFGLTTG